MLFQSAQRRNPGLRLSCSSMASPGSPPFSSRKRAQSADCCTCFAPIIAGLSALRVQRPSRRLPRLRPAEKGRPYRCRTEAFLRDVWARGVVRVDGELRDLDLESVARCNKSGARLNILGNGRSLHAPLRHRLLDSQSQSARKPKASNNVRFLPITTVIGVNGRFLCVFHSLPRYILRFLMLTPSRVAMVSCPRKDQRGRSRSEEVPQNASRQPAD